MRFEVTELELVMRALSQARIERPLPEAHGSSRHWFRSTSQDYWIYIITFVACLGSLTAVLSRAWTRQPFVDEAWYAMPAWNLTLHGSTGNRMIEPSGSLSPGMDNNLLGIREHTYLPPLTLPAQVIWYRLFGFGLFTLRLFSAAWGAVILAACFFLVLALTGDKAVAMLSVSLVAIDSVFIPAASLGRMDTMSAALGFSGLALYSSFRSQSLEFSILFSHLLIVASGLSHPNGGMLSFLGLAFLTWHFDRSRLQPAHIPLAGCAYLAGSLGWGIYILQDPAAFKCQFFQNIAGRFGTWSSPLTLIGRELGRYLNVYGFNPGTSLAGHSRVLVLLSYTAALAMVVSRRDLRRHPGFRALLYLTIIAVLGLLFLENYKVQQYLIYVVPFLAILTAICVQALFHRFSALVIASALAGLMAIQVGGILRIARRNDYARDYLPAVRFLKERAGSNMLVMAS